MNNKIFTIQKLQLQSDRVTKTFQKFSQEICEETGDRLRESLTVMLE